MHRSDEDAAENDPHHRRHESVDGRQGGTDDRPGAGDAGEVMREDDGNPCRHIVAPVVDLLRWSWVRRIDAELACHPAAVIATGQTEDDETGDDDEYHIHGLLTLSNLFRGAR